MELVALWDALDAAIFYRHYQLAQYLHNTYNIKIETLFRSDDFKSFNIDKRIENRELAWNLENDNEMLFFNLLKREIEKLPLIMKIFVVGGTYDQLMRSYRYIGKKLGRNSKISILFNIFEIRYGNFNLIFGLWPPKKITINRRLNMIISSPNRRARKYWIKENQIERVTPNVFNGRELKKYIESPKLLRLFIKEFPTEAQMIVARSYGVLEDEEYLELIKSYNLPQNIIRDIFNDLIVIGYEYLAHRFKQEFRSWL